MTDNADNNSTNLPIRDLHSLKDRLFESFEPQNPAIPIDPLKLTLPDILKSNQHGLSQVPPDVLEKCIQPVLEGLGGIDAQALLELEESKDGAILNSGMRVKPIHQEIQPPCPDDTVRYIHLSEEAGQYSMGIFIFPPHAKIPLHDHPGMCVLSRVLYGSLKRLSLDLSREDVNGTENMPPSKPKPHQGNRGFFSSPWRMSWKSHTNENPPIPEGARRAFKHHVDSLVAPDCTVLYPFEGNLHDFEAGPDGAAVLDVLFPPYDEHGRDCTFYNILDLNEEDDSDEEMSDSEHSDGGPDRKPCIIVPTGQPESFHCISGHYRALGAS